MRRPTSNTTRRLRCPADGQPQALHGSRYAVACADRAGAESHRVGRLHRLAAVQPRVPGETITAYLKRLREANGEQVRGTLYARATGGGAPLFAAQQRAATTRNAPRRRSRHRGPVDDAHRRAGAVQGHDRQLGLGRRVRHRVERRRHGRASASVTGVPATLAAGRKRSGDRVADRACECHERAPSNVGHVEGRQRQRLRLVQRSANTSVREPAALKLTKTATIVDDSDHNGRASAGDTLEYKISAENTGGMALNESHRRRSSAAKQQTLGSSPTSTQGSAALVTDGSGVETVRAPLGTLGGGSTATVKFRAIVLPLATGTTKPITVENQAIATSDQLAPPRRTTPRPPPPDDPTALSSARVRRS